MQFKTCVQQSSFPVNWEGNSMPINLKSLILHEYFVVQFDVKEAKVIESHPQWDISDDEDDKASGSDHGSDSQDDDDDSEFEYDED